MDARTGSRPDDLPPYRVSLVDPGQIAAALPHLLGFRPRQSLVLVSLTGPRGARVGLTARADIPPPEHAGTLAGLLVRSLLTDGPAAALLVVVSDDGDEDDDGLPHRALVGEATSALAAERIPVREALLVRGDRWWSYDCPSACCAPARGTPLPAGTSELAAATVAAGVVVADSREALTARIAPAGGVAARAMATTARRVAAEAAARAQEIGPEGMAAESWAALRAGVAHSRAGVALSDAALARVLWGLGDVSVRDRALQLALDGDPAVEAFYTQCVRRAPRRHVPAPATLLAVGAWLRGDGAMARVALDRALAVDRTYRLARLLSQALAVCLPPADLRALIVSGTAEELLGARER